MVTTKKLPVPRVEVIFSPALYPYRLIQDKHTVIMADILRASTTICAALYHGVSAIKPVTSFEEAQAEKSRGYLVAAESHGVKPAFADFGNSAFEFMNPDLTGKKLVYCTTNGTKSILMARDADTVAIGAFSNLSRLSGFLSQHGKDVVILCSGWKNAFNLEDSVFAGALCSNLLFSGNFVTSCDSAHAAVDLWEAAKNDLSQYMMKAAHRTRLYNLQLAGIIPYSLTVDTCPVVPILKDGWLISA